MALIECYECQKQVSDSASACPSCGAPVKKVAPSSYTPPQMKSPTAAPRRVGFLLAIGIFFLPFIFSWVVLRKGYSNLTRSIVFGWLFIFFALPGWTGSHSTSTQSTSTKGAVAEDFSTPVNPEYTKKEIARRLAAEAAEEKQAAEARARELASLPMVTASQIAQAYEENTVAADQMFKDKRFRVTGVVASINTDFLGKPYITLRGGVNQFMEPQFSFETENPNRVAALRKGSKVTLVCHGKGDIAKTPMSDECQFL